MFVEYQRRWPSLGNPRTPITVPVAVLIVVTVLGLLLGSHGATDSSLAQDVSGDDATVTPDESAPPPRLREGATLNNEVGRFMRIANRLTFATADGRYKLVVLENLALERVAQLESSRLGAYDWTVSGEVTEYQGKNYLLIRRANTNQRVDSASARPGSI